MLFRSGLGKLDEQGSAQAMESVFAEELDGHNLITNRSIWRNFPTIRCERWTHDNTVLLGDAKATAHFSIGSGTKLAMEDAIALETSLARHGRDIPAALAAYEAARRPIVETLVAAANASAEWYEHFAAHMRLKPYEFAMSYITRSGRIDFERLRRTSPEFVAAYEARASTGGSPRG